MQVGIANTNWSTYPVSNFSLRSFLVDGVVVNGKNEGTFVKFIRSQRGYNLKGTFGLVQRLFHFD